VPSTNDAAASLTARVDDLGTSVRRVQSGELHALSRSIADRRMQQHEMSESLSLALALCREALRRAVGLFVDLPVVNAVAEALTGAVPTVPDGRGRNAAIAMALHWYSLAGKGAHFVSWDERRAREAIAFFEPVGALLGCDARLITDSMAGSSRSQAYGAAVTFGACSEMAADYLRDNLHDLRTNVVQRGLYAAVTDDVNQGLVEQALSHVVITAPGSGILQRSRGADAVAASLRSGVDYRVDRDQRAIVFSASGLVQIKSAVGWGNVPSLKAVTAAERIENIIAHREGIGRSDDREVLADISTQGYLRVYESLAGFSSKGKPSESVDRILQERRETLPYLRELTFERLIDRQRAKVYPFREAVRDSPDTLSLLRPIVIDTVQAWMAAGAEALIKGIQDLIAGWQTPEQIDDLLKAGSFQADVLDAAALLVETVVERRIGQLGRTETAAFLQKVLLTVVDLQWHSHVARMRFIQRQSNALYYHAGDLDEARNADGESLFAGCEQAIRVDSIKYLLNAHP
jgi:preprotein translocase subunit SecA